MRIRKRKVPLPLSLLSPVPLSDPYLFSRSPVQNTTHDNNTTTTTTLSSSSSPLMLSSSDHLSTTKRSAADPRRSGPLVDNDSTSKLASATNTTVDATGFEVVDNSGLQINNNEDNISNASIRSATEINDDSGRSLSLSNNEDQVVGRWCDGDKAIPLKKRRGIGFDTFVESSIFDGMENDMTTTTITTTTSMKLDNTGSEEEKQIVEGNNDKVAAAAASVAAVSAKKGNAKRGNTIMEGSRCSRVNGRGWRCCQPTLVGYSLCEHHLGKGRLRSMTSNTSAKSRSSKKKSNSTNGTKFALGRVEEVEAVEDNSEKKLERMSSFGNNKRVKLGVVKARSLSSLLGQTNSMNIVADHADIQQHEKISSLDYQ
ncbi:histone-lysine N-methyltransferase, H3 lysine-79 specific-like [Chenopodium quinoa]|uniref:histone-lysine N-methyltransferase, H3 lysine-79 specific-like n=1 Tax=Chenopodium quinoa TaxID=63459 RepID=UPI000B7918DA|nr:histone-lysine N-methyltransferase, H3 lysine-79 specific-like [Chenopodium quinoa]